MIGKSKTLTVKPLGETNVANILDRPLTRSSGILREKAETKELKDVEEFETTFEKKLKDRKLRRGTIKTTETCSSKKTELLKIDRKQTNKRSPINRVEKETEATVKRTVAPAKKISNEAQKTELHKIVEKFTDATKKRKHEDSYFVEPENKDRRLRLMTSAFKCK